MTAEPQTRRKRTTMEVVRSLRQPKVAVMLALGFASGLPFLLTQNTLGYWLRDEGTSLKAIGFISWVGLAYSFKFLWSPIVDRVDLPLLAHRQLGVGAVHRQARDAELLRELAHRGQARSRREGAAADALLDVAGELAVQRL